MGTFWCGDPYYHQFFTMRNCVLSCLPKIMDQGSAVPKSFQYTVPSPLTCCPLYQGWKSYMFTAFFPLLFEFWLVMQKHHFGFLGSFKPFNISTGLRIFPISSCWVGLSCLDLQWSPLDERMRKQNKNRKTRGQKCRAKSGRSLDFSSSHWASSALEYFQTFCFVLIISFYEDFLLFKAHKKNLFTWHCCEARIPTQKSDSKAHNLSSILLYWTLPFTVFAPRVLKHLKANGFLPAHSLSSWHYLEEFSTCPSEVSLNISSPGKSSLIFAHFLSFFFF